MSTSPLAELEASVGPGIVFAGDAINADWLHDESLHSHHEQPLAVVIPKEASQVAEVARWAQHHRIPLVARGSGTGMSGASAASAGSVVVAFHRLNRIISIDLANHTARVEAGVTLQELNAALEGSGLYYPVHPGELSGSLGGNVNTNAGGMRAVRYGVTRHHVLGLSVVLADGQQLELGGAVVKSSSGYDLTQLIIGSEGTLALVTEVEVKLSPRPQHVDTMLVPFRTLPELAHVVPELITAGLQPAILEYLDVLTMASVTARAAIEFGVAPDVAADAQAYLVIVLETRTREQMDLDIAQTAQLVLAAGALDVYVLASGAGHRLIAAREEAFWVAKDAGANDIIDVVVPRAAVTEFLATIHDPTFGDGAFIAGCGHIGDGNVHLSIFQADEERRTDLLRRIFALGTDLGGEVSGEHGLGRDKRHYWHELVDPRTLQLQRQIKSLFDPQNILNPDLDKDYP